MKKYLFLLLLPLSSLSFAQTTDSEKQKLFPNNELSIKAGPAIETSSTYFSNGVGLHTGLSYLHNIKNLQVGVTLDGGLTSDNWYYLAPSVVFNHLFSIKRSYAYFGATVGYYYKRKSDGYFSMYDQETGYTAGLQVGYVTPISKRLSFATEVAVKTIQVWYDDYYHVPDGISTLGHTNAYEIPVRAQQFYLDIPITVGLRYKF